MPKADKSTQTDQIETALNRAQVLFSLNPAYAPTATHLWKAQERVMKEVEAFSSAWFRRRHEATQSALDVAAKLASGGAKDPATSMKAITNWQARSMERMAEDARDYTEMMTRCVGSLVTNEIESVEETAENTKRTFSDKHATPV